MVKCKFVFFFVLILSIQNCTQENKTTKIAWDEWGVPHIYSDSEEDLFYAQGWAQMQLHANLILDLYGSARGRAAEYWGADRLENDVIIHTLGIPELAQSWREQQDPRLKNILQAFINGMNDFAEKNPDKIQEENKVVLPLSVDDVNQHAMFVVYTRFVGANELGMAQRWSDKGSNTYAIGPNRSASGNAMLVQNPHLPWWREFTFWESHLNYGDNSIYGSNLVGLPGIAIGFNNNLGWSHTDNTIDNADTYELTLSEGGYLLDGEKKEFDKISKILKIKGEDGKVQEQNFDFYTSVHGPVVKMGESKALAVRMVGRDTPNASLQWWEMANSSNLEEFEAALKMAQIPFWNVMYADKHGDIFYIFNGRVPKRAKGGWGFWSRIIPGDDSENIWTEVHPYEDLPKVKNPTNGWLQNANDPPWTSTIPPSLDPEDFPDYMAPNYMNFRPQRSARMLIEDESITFEELVDYKHSTRLEFADRILDDLFEAIDASESELAKEAKVVLENWDRCANKDSKGMVLFYNWANKFQVWNNRNYEVAWSWDAPNTTPDGLADPQRAVSLLEAAAEEVKAGFGNLEVEWGEVYRIEHNNKELSGNGVDGSLGVFRVLWPSRRDGTKVYASGGDSWVGVIEFGEKIKAKVLLSYGNSSEEDSPHNGDQLEHFSNQKLRDAWFYSEDLKDHIVKTEVRTDEGFTAENK